jgi:hypothetical protein
MIGSLVSCFLGAGFERKKSPRWNREVRALMKLLFKAFIEMGVEVDCPSVFSAHFSHLIQNFAKRDFNRLQKYSDHLLTRHWLYLSQIFDSKKVCFASKMKAIINVLLLVCPSIPR